MRIEQLIKGTKHTSGGTLFELKRELTESEQWDTAANIAEGMNSLYEQVYKQPVSPGNRSEPIHGPDGIRIYSTIEGERTQVRIRTKDVMVHRAHKPLKFEDNSTAGRIRSTITGARISRDEQ